MSQSDLSYFAVAEWAPSLSFPAYYVPFHKQNPLTSRLSEPRPITTITLRAGLHTRVGLHAGGQLDGRWPTSTLGAGLMAGQFTVSGAMVGIGGLDIRWFL